MLLCQQPVALPKQATDAESRQLLLRPIVQNFQRRWLNPLAFHIPWRHARRKGRRSVTGIPEPRDTTTRRADRVLESIHRRMKSDQEARAIRCPWMRWHGSTRRMHVEAIQMTETGNNSASENNARSGKGGARENRRREGHNERRVMMWTDTKRSQKRIAR